MVTRDSTGFRQVRNKWYYGLGVRRLPEGWMYNVWGLDGVELGVVDSQTFRVAPASLQICWPRWCAYDPAPWVIGRPLLVRRTLERGRRGSRPMVPAEPTMKPTK
jgi:hypothetical protein